MIWLIFFWWIDDHDAIINNLEIKNQSIEYFVYYCSRFFFNFFNLHFSSFFRLKFFQHWSHFEFFIFLKFYKINYFIKALFSKILFDKFEFISKKKIRLCFSFLFSKKNFHEIIIIYQMTNFIFVFCESFFDQKSISTNKWFLKYDHEIFNYIQNDLISLDKYLVFLNMLFIDKAIDWSKNYFDVIKFLKDFNSFQQTIKQFKFLFCGCFLFKIV